MKCVKILSPFNEKDLNSNICEISFQNFQKFVDMGLGLEISFHQFLLNLLLNEKTYLLALQCTIQTPTLFLKCKPNDIQTNAFNIHVRPLREANTNP
jgi:hypothetical protein